MEDWVPIIISLVALGLAIYNFFRDRSMIQEEGTKGYNASWQVFNQALISDPDFLAIEQKLHPFGDLSDEEMKRVYFWFMRLNVSYSAYRSSQSEFMSNRLAQSSLANEANLSFKDQDFLRNHVFTRGYDKDYTDSIEKLWKQIAERGKTIPMLGDDEEEHVVPISLPAKPRTKRKRKIAI